MPELPAPSYSAVYSTTPATPAEHIRRWLEVSRGGGSLPAEPNVAYELGIGQPVSKLTLALAVVRYVNGSGPDPSSADSDLARAVYELVVAADGGAA